MYFFIFPPSPPPFSLLLPFSFSQVLAMQDKTAAVRSLAEQLMGVLTARALVSRQVDDKTTPLPLISPLTSQPLDHCSTSRWSPA